MKASFGTGVGCDGAGKQEGKGGKRGELPETHHIPLLGFGAPLMR